MDCKAMRSIIRTDALEELLTDAQLAAFGLPPGEKACDAHEMMIYYGGVCCPGATAHVMMIYHGGAYAVRGRPRT